MIGEPKVGTLDHCVISAVIFEPLKVATKDGKPLRLAIIDEDGTVIEAGQQVAREAFNVAVASYRKFLIGQGHIRVMTAPPHAEKTA